MLLHYRLGERLGTGASGDVYLAEDLRLHRPVALKMLRADTAQDEEAPGRLLREARVASSLSHPNIAVVYEVGEAFHEGQKRGFIAMEHVRGRTLLERLREGPLPAEEALAVTRQVAEALQEAHDRGVVHRDVKPGNVMVNERGLVKVLDRGGAHHLRSLQVSRRRKIEHTKPGNRQHLLFLYRNLRRVCPGRDRVHRHCRAKYCQQTQPGKKQLC